MRELLSRFYPIQRGYQLLREHRDRWHYQWLCRRHGVVVHPERASKLARDIVAVDLLRKATEQHEWVPRDLYPAAGGAADHKLLYILIRALAEHSFNNVLELGAGETTRVLDAYAAHTGASVTTVEHDARWVELLSREGVAPTHTMMPAPLISLQDARAGGYQGYELRDRLDADARFDLIVVDGPPGSARWSRYGAVELVGKHHAREFVALWDDVDRVGELQSFGASLSALKAADVDVDHHMFVSERTLGAMFTAGFSGIRHVF